MIDNFLFGMAISISFMPVWYLLIEILDKFYQAFRKNLSDE